MCGYAVTAQVESVTQLHAIEERNFLELFKVVEGSSKPAVVALQEIGGHADYAAHCGEVMATAFTRLGAVGLIEHVLRGFSWPVGLGAGACVGFGVARRFRAPTRRSSRRPGIAARARDLPSDFAGSE